MEELQVVSIEDQIESIDEQIEMAEKERDERLATLRDMVDQRFERMLEMWGGALGFEQAAEKLRLFMGSDGELNFQQLVIIRRQVEVKLNGIHAAYKEDAKEDDVDWTTWLDKWCNEADGAYKSVTEVVTELLVLDICQGIWEALRRISEFSEAVDEQLDKMRRERAGINGEGSPE